jgi:DNA-binding HxlR family transcriptional regulator
VARPAERSLSQFTDRGWSPEIVRPLIELIAGRWVLAIFCALDAGPLRRVVLRDQLGHVSDKVLTETLRRLERHGLISRTIVASVPVEVHYSLTAVARRLARLFPELHEFAIQERGSARPKIVPVASPFADTAYP